MVCSLSGSARRPAGAACRVAERRDPEPSRRLAMIDECPACRGAGDPQERRSMTSTGPFSGELTVRAPAPDDLQAVFDLVTESDVREFGEPDYPFEEFAANWQATD